MKWTVLCLMVGLLYSCDQGENFNGVVLSKNTNKPIDSVAAIMSDHDDPGLYLTEHTGPDGAFHISQIVGKAQDENYIFYKTGYKPHKQKLKLCLKKDSAYKDTIYLEYDGYFK